MCTIARVVALSKNKTADFEAVFLPHLDAAYNLARWLTRDPTDADDVVQEAYFRAFKFFEGFHGGDSRAWLLTIVRNTCYTWLQQNRSREFATGLDDDSYTAESDTPDPEAALLKNVDNEMVRRAIDELPVEFREAIVLRELEEMSYKQIADISGVPLGTVMSRLARGRKRLQQVLTRAESKEHEHEVQ